MAELISASPAIVAALGDVTSIVVFLLMMISEWETTSAVRFSPGAFRGILTYMGDGRRQSARRVRPKWRQCKAISIQAREERDTTVPQRPKDNRVIFILHVTLKSVRSRRGDSRWPTDPSVLARRRMTQPKPSSRFRSCRQAITS